ncbi:MAG: LPS assembly protein LptD, partial [bacterium]
MKGNVGITQQEGSIEADQGTLNLDNETGEFSNIRFTLEDGGYQLQSAKATKYSETKYHLTDMKATTCGCDKENPPWQISAEECNITQEGYAHAYDTTFRFYGVPIFYTPYIGFPAKIERTSGLLGGQMGYSGTDGFQYRQPYYAVWDDSSDSTITPFTETKTRNGFFFDYDREQSKYNSMKGRFLYSDESPRGDGPGSDRGTNTTGITDPQFDQNRYGAFYTQSWTSEPDPDFSLGYFSDVHYVSDNLLLREINDNGIGASESLYTVSTMALRSTVGQHLNTELVGEYNQNLTGDQDTQLQRLPTLNADYLRSDRVFGENEYGLKLASQLSANSVTFTRDEGYDGQRTTLTPKLSVPFRYKNYFNSNASAGVYQTYYSMNDRSQVGDPTQMLDSSYDRTLPVFSYSASTGLERVYSLDKDSSLTQMTSLGKDNQVNYLARVKHTIDPTVSFLLVPEAEQDQNPFYDGFDRQQQRQLVRYGFNSRMLGRFVPRLGSTDDIPEIAPRPQDLPMFDATRPLSELGAVSNDSIDNALLRPGEIRELATFGMSQGYDFTEKDKDNSPATNVSYDGITTYRNPGIRPASDVRTTLGLFPTSNFALSVDNYYDTYDHNASNWILAGSFTTDRGDALRARYFYYRDPTTGLPALSQIEGNTEIALIPGLKAGYYTLYNFDYLQPNSATETSQNEFIEQRVALRITPDCDCWHFDIGFIDATNPDKQTILFSFNFGGLGDINQGLLVNNQEN